MSDDADYNPEQFYHVQRGRLNKYYGFDPSGDHIEAATLAVRPAHTEYHYDFDRYEGENGQGQLFGVDHTPAYVDNFYSTPRGHHLVTALLAHAHRMHGGDLTYSDDMRRGSYGVAKKALSEGLIKPRAISYISGYSPNVQEQRELLPQDALYGTLDKIYHTAARSQNEVYQWQQEAKRWSDVKVSEIPSGEIAASRQHLKSLLRKPKKSESTDFEQLTLPYN